MSFSRGRAGIRLYLFNAMANKITALKQQKSNPDRVNVFLDGEFAFGLEKITAAWLKIGEQLSAAKIQELQTNDAVEKAYQRALNYLSYRPRSTAEVERNLRKHDVDDAVIDEVVTRLQDKAWLDDDAFAAAWVENRNIFRPRGRFALQAELRQKGLADAVIERALQEQDEEGLAHKAAQKKARQLGGLDEEEFRKKLYAFLGRRGFDYAIISEICSEAWAEIQNTSRHKNPEKGTRN
jgi:regulatory protein